MRIVGFVPSKLNSERIPQKNIQPLGGVPLVNYVLKTLNQAASIHETVLFASEPSICGYIQPGIRYTFLERPPWLDTQKANMQDFLQEFLKHDAADIIVLLHCTSPFITPATVEACVSRVSSGEYHASFAAFALQKFCWYRHKTLNYSLAKPLPRTQDLEPLVVEQSGLYVFTRKLFEEKRHRIDERSHIHIVDEFEGHDIDTPDDLAMAELILSRMKKRN